MKKVEKCHVIYLGSCNIYTTIYFLCLSFVLIEISSKSHIFFKDLGIYSLCFLDISNLFQVWLTGNTFKNRLDPKSQLLRMISAVLKRTEHEPEVGHATQFPCSLELTLFIHAPDWVAFISDIVTKNLSDRFNSVGKTGGQNDKVVLLFSFAIQHDTVFGEADGISLLNFDFPLDDSCPSASIKVESSVSGVSESCDGLGNLTI